MPSSLLFRQSLLAMAGGLLLTAVPDLSARSHPDSDPGRPAATCVPTPTSAGTCETTALVRTAWQLLEAGAYWRALEQFALASELEPDEVSVLVGLGLAHRMLGHDAQAVAVLERAIRRDMFADRAHGLLGDLYAEREDYERALHHYRIARDQQPNDARLRARLERTVHAYHADQDYDRLHTRHFVIKYRPGVLPSERIHHLADRLERIYQEIGTAMSAFPAHTFTVIVYGAEDFQERTGSPAWVRGLFDGRIHVTMQAAPANSGVSEGVLRHEYVHALVDRMSAGRAPVWLSEGLALSLEGSTEWEGHGGDGVPASDLAVSIAVPHDFVGLAPVDARAAYAHSYRATRHLIQRYGLPRIRDLLQELSRTAQISDAFRSVLHVDYGDFEMGWLSGGENGGRP